MNTSCSATIPSAPPVSRRRRWWRVVLLMVALVVLVPLLLLGYTILSTRHAWAEAEAEADLDTPRWRLMDLEADRPDIPDNENSALHIISVRRKARGFAVGLAPNYEKIFDKLPPTAQLNMQQSELIRGQLAKIAKPLEEARKLKDMPRGRFPITYSDDFIGTLLPDHHDSRALVEWLQHDAMLLAQDKQYDQAVESCQAILNAGRSMDGELLLICHLIRVAEQGIAITTLERVLAQGQASEDRLQAMQALLDKDLQGNGWLPAVRGDRAGSHYLFDNIRTGKVKSAWLTNLGVRLGGGGDIIDSVGMWVADEFPSALLKYYPEYLRHMNRCVDIAKLPVGERPRKMKEWEDEARNTRNPVIRKLASSLSKVTAAECRHQAMLRSAMAALACERYRLKHKNNAWPASLDALVKEKLLDAIPADPMDNQPLRYRRTKEGVVLYSIGMDLTDNHGNIDREVSWLEPGQDIGFRLWNVDRRRQAPLPPVPIPE